MSGSVTQRDSLRRLVRRRIERDQVVLTLHTQVKTPNNAGGWKWTAGPDRDPQRFTLMRPTTQPVAAGPSPLMFDEADRAISIMLLGERTATVAQGDWWTDEQGVRNDVVYVYPLNGYETRALVQRRG